MSQTVGHKKIIKKVIMSISALCSSLRRRLIEDRCDNLVPIVNTCLGVTTSALCFVGGAYFIINRDSYEYNLYAGISCCVIGSIGSLGSFYYLITKCRDAVRRRGYVNIEEGGSIN